jgi:hypothetical protein
LTGSHLLGEKKTSLIVLGHMGLLLLGFTATVAGPMTKFATFVALLAPVHWRLGPSLASSVRNGFATGPGALAAMTTFSVTFAVAGSTTTT